MRSRNRLVLLAIFAITLLFGSTFQRGLLGEAADDGVTYYVAKNHPGASDSNTGSAQDPWLTIQHAAEVMGAGDRVIVLAGEYSERVQIRTSGSPGFPITYRAEGTAVMRGFTILADHITIQGFEITDTPDSSRDGIGVFVEGSHCVVEDNYVHFATRGGILLSATAGNESNTSDCVIRNNRLYRNAMSGISVEGRNHLVEGNEIWKTIQHHPNWAERPSWVDADGMRYFGSGHMIRGNYIHDISFNDPENVDPHIDCFQTWSDDYHEAASDVIFDGNICEVLTTQAERENGHGFMLADARNIVIRNNIIKAYGGVNTGGGGNSDLVIVNNIFMNDLSFHQFWPGAVGLESAPNSIVKNNIFYDQPYHTVSVTGDRSGQEIDYNLAYRSDGQPSDCYRIDYVCVDPPPSHDLWDVDPLFVDPALGDFHLQQGSPAIDTGIALAEVINDFDGNPRPQGEGQDIGPFEFVGGTPTFADVPFDHWAYDYIEKLYQEGYVAGCNTDPLMYCPEQIMTRAESAVFVERGVHGADYYPDQPIEQIFVDVPLNEWFAKWSTALWNDGFTDGCGTDPLVYCPLQEHTRAEGSVFFLRMMHGADYVPPDPGGNFTDVSLEWWGAKWVEAAYNAGIIPACETDPELKFCPNDPLDRAMGAYMMVKAKGLEGIH
jgi:hypothetical protein